MLTNRLWTLRCIVYLVMITIITSTTFVGTIYLFWSYNSVTILNNFVKLLIHLFCDKDLPTAALLAISLNLVERFSELKPIGLFPLKMLGLSPNIHLVECSLLSLHWSPILTWVDWPWSVPSPYTGADCPQELGVIALPILELVGLGVISPPTLELISTEVD